MKRPPQLFTIPAGSIARPCRGHSCREGVYDVKMPSGKVAPIHVNRDLHVECLPPSEPGSTTQHDGRGISHFIDCVDAKQFNTRGRR